MTAETINEIVAEADAPAQSLPGVSEEPIMVKVGAVSLPEDSDAEDLTNREAPVASEPPAPVAAALPPPDLSAAGLQLVETAGTPVPEPATREEGEAQAAKPRRRSRPRSGDTVPAAEPLQLVETRSPQPEVTAESDAPPAAWGPPSNPRRRARPKMEDAAQAEPLVMVETKPAGQDGVTTS